MSSLITALSQVLPARQVIHDELRRLAYGTDASFYRLTPEVIALRFANVASMSSECWSMRALVARK